MINGTIDEEGGELSMMQIIVDVRYKVAVKKCKTVYVCGNSDYIIRFGFDAEWDEYDTKTARFEYNGQHQDIVFTGSECPVPIISDVYSFNVGVYAGDLRTTTPAYIPCKKSILCGGGVPADPMPDVYAQIMEKLNNLDVEVSPEEIAKAVEDYLAENPVEGVTPEQVQEAVNEALQNAKESGEFDGPAGPAGPAGQDGAPGEDGKTPVKGEDYWTPEDQQQIINEVLGQVGGGGASEDVYEVITQWTAHDEWTDTLYTWSDLAHKKLIIIVEAAAGTADSTIEFVWNWKSLGYTQKGIRNGVKSKSVCFVDTYLVNDEDGAKRYLSAACSENGYESDTAQNRWDTRGFGLPGTVILGANTAINQITIRCAANNLLPVGSVVTILGVKA